MNFEDSNIVCLSETKDSSLFKTNVQVEHYSYEYVINNKNCLVDIDYVYVVGNNVCDLMKNQHNCAIVQLYIKVNMVSSSVPYIMYDNFNSEENFKIINQLYLSGNLKSIDLCLKFNDCMDVTMYKNYHKFDGKQNIEILIDQSFLSKTQKLIQEKPVVKRPSVEYYLLDPNGNKLHTPINKGKIRDIYDIGWGNLVIEVTDKVSSFDKVYGSIEGKGVLLNNISGHNFRKVSGVPTHYLYHNNKYMVVKKCSPIKLEVIVRGYITGSLWKLYQSHGYVYVNNLYGINLPDGLKQNQKLDSPIITPTTKDIHDTPISPMIFTDPDNDNFILNANEWNLICYYALNLFESGQQQFKDLDILLVDTKYEFGRDIKANGKIVLIDELHTPDSSRFWKASTYQDGEKPLCYDKQFFRDWLVSSGNKDNESNDIDIPDNIKAWFIKHYQFIHDRMGISDTYVLKKNLYDIFYEYYLNVCEKIVVVCAGSFSDEAWVVKIVSEIRKVGYGCIVLYGSAHKETERVVENLKSLYKYNINRNIVFVTVAGRSNALSGVVACNVKSPVIACPPFKDKIDMATNINSTLVMPCDVPVMTILEPRNVALCIQRILK
jgi:fusion protein PurCD